MRFRTRKPKYRKHPKTVTVQQLWIKVTESVIPIPVAMTERTLATGDSLEITVTADELIDAIGTNLDAPALGETDHD